MANARKKYRVLCWGDCKKFPELGKCYLSFAHTDKRVYEGEVTDIIPAVSIHWLIADKMIEEVGDDVDAVENSEGGEQ